MKFSEVLKRKDGAFSILFVILVLVGVIVVAGFTDILRQSYHMNETQSIMDVAGISALRTGVDEEYLRIGELRVDQTMVRRDYQDMVQRTLNGYGNIEDVRFIRTHTEAYKETWGLGETSSARDQVLLDSVVVIKVKSSPMFDVFPMLADKYYNSRSGTDFTVSYLGETEDGLTELSIRSVSRIVYR